MKLKIWLILPFYFTALSCAVAQSDASYFRKGNEQYKDGKFNEAEIQYRKGLEQLFAELSKKYQLEIDIILYNMFLYNIYYCSLFY